MNMKVSFKKIAMILIVVYLLLNAIRCITSNSIADAAVNEECGTVSFFITPDNELKSYDVHGTLLYSKKFDFFGSADLEYHNGQLHVYELRTDTVYVLNERGEIVDQSTYDGQMNTWMNWESDSWGYSFTTDTHVYRYRHPNFGRWLIFQRTVDFEITDVESEETILIWELYE